MSFTCPSQAGLGSLSHKDTDTETRERLVQTAHYCLFPPCKDFMLPLVLDVIYERIACIYIINLFHVYCISQAFPDHDKCLGERTLKEERLILIHGFGT